MTGRVHKRRDFLLKLLGLGTFAGFSGLSYSHFIEPRWIKRTFYDLKSRKWPDSHRPLKVAVAADIHVGCPSVRLEDVSRTVDQLNAMNADCILLLGDFMISGVLLGKKVGAAQIGRALSKLNAPLGVFAVLGNHDWWEDGPGMWEALEKAGIQVLENDAVKVQREGQGAFWVAGLADDTTRKPDLTKTLRKVDTNDPVVLMTHDPATFLDGSDVPVVTLAGHTHGGQVAAPFWGAMVVPGRAPLKYAYGHIVEEGRDLIVSSGIGTSILPIRFNQRPEIIHLNLSAANS